MTLASTLTKHVFLFIIVMPLIFACGGGADSGATNNAEIKKESENEGNGFFGRRGKKDTWHAHLNQILNTRNCDMVGGWSDNKPLNKAEKKEVNKVLDMLYQAGIDWPHPHEVINSEGNSLELLPEPQIQKAVEVTQTISNNAISAAIAFIENDDTYETVSEEYFPDGSPKKVEKRKDKDDYNSGYYMCKWNEKGEIMEFSISDIPGLYSIARAKRNKALNKIKSDLITFGNGAITIRQRYTGNRLYSSSIEFAGNHLSASFNHNDVLDFYFFSTSCYSSKHETLSKFRVAEKSEDGSRKYWENGNWVEEDWNSDGKVTSLKIYDLKENEYSWIMFNYGNKQIPSDTVKHEISKLPLPKSSHKQKVDDNNFNKSVGDLVKLKEWVYEDGQYYLKLSEPCYREDGSSNGRKSTTYFKNGKVKSRKGC